MTEISSENLNNLREVQQDLLTQDLNGQQEPAFWMIAGTEDYVTAPGYGYATIIVDPDGNEIAREDDIQAAIDHFNEVILPGLNPKQKIAYENAYPVTECQYLDHFMNLLGLINVFDYELLTVASRQKIYTDALFLTRQDCERHLKAYGYNYDKAAHPFAMTANRSPSYQAVIKFLKETDFGSEHN